DDIRIDAEVSREALAPNSPVSVTYQIQNLSKATIAVADKMADTDFDLESMTVKLSIGTEIPPAQLPRLVTIRPVELLVMTGAELRHVAITAIRTRWTAVQHYVQVKVTVLRDVTPFAALIEQQKTSTVPVALPNSMFDCWVEASGSILLNRVPVYWRGDSNRGAAEAGRPGAD